MASNCPVSPGVPVFTRGFVRLSYIKLRTVDKMKEGCGKTPIGEIICGGLTLPAASSTACTEVGANSLHGDAVSVLEHCQAQF